MTQMAQVEKSAIVKAARDLRMIGVNEQTGKVIFWSLVTDAISMANELKTLTKSLRHAAASSDDV